jgi:hypothetical protein
MATPRRRLLRPTNTSPPPDPRDEERLRRLRERLASERAALARWMTRFRRAFTQVEKRQRCIARIEREIHQREGS